MDTIRNEIEIIDTKPIAVINSSCMNTWSRLGPVEETISLFGRNIEENFMKCSPDKQRH
jgi:hypothetical protein